MSDLSDLVEDVSKDLPAAVRKVLDTALAAGWELNKPGMTLALRLNHPTDELAAPVYILWAVGRTPTGRLSFKFVSCATATLVPLTGADLLEYLQDPTVAYSTAEELEDEYNARQKPPKWDVNGTPENNVKAQLGGEVIGIEVVRPARKGRKTAAQIMAEAKAGATSQPLRVAVPALRVQIPSVNPQSLGS